MSEAYIRGKILLYCPYLTTQRSFNLSADSKSQSLTYLNRTLLYKEIFDDNSSLISLVVTLTEIGGDIGGSGGDIDGNWW